MVLWEGEPPGEPRRPGSISNGEGSAGASAFHHWLLLGSFQMMDIALLDPPYMAYGRNGDNNPNRQGISPYFFPAIS